MTVSRTSTTPTTGSATANAPRRDDSAQPAPDDIDPASLIRAIDHIEWWVGNARAFADSLCALYGFTPVAYRGPETGERNRVSHVVAQGDIYFVVSGALTPDSPIAEHVRLHGDGAHDVAFKVDDVDRVHAALLARGGLAPANPSGRDRHVDSDGDEHRDGPDGSGVTEAEDDHGTLRRAAIGTYGETRHSLIDRSNYHGPFAPGFVPASDGPGSGNGERPVGLGHIDHVVGNVERGRLEQWVRYYEETFGFRQFLHFSDDQISTEYSALSSTVVWNGGKVVLPINEPADGRRKSQIEEYLDYYHSPGVQHLALHTTDIVTTVQALRRRGVRFLTVPPEYYVEARERLAGVELDWEALAELGILVDRDPDGHLLQIFTQPVADRPTVFFEIIQREGCQGFGEGNFKALFEAIERAQAARGNL